MIKSVVPYDEFATVQDKKALRADLKAIKLDEHLIHGKRKVMDQSVLDILNAFIRQGEALQRMSKHEQISFRFIQQILPELPWGKNAREVFETAKRRVAFAADFKGGIKSLADIAPDSRRQLLLHLGLLTSGERGGDGAAPAINDPFTHFLSDITRFKQDFQKCIRSKSLEDMTRPQLEDFYSSTEWVVEAREQARRLIDGDKA